MSVLQHKQTVKAVPAGGYRRGVTAGFGLSLFFFIFYKSIYPQPDFFPESYKYVTAANEGLTVHFRLPGYALFLRLLHVFSNSANLVVWSQWLLLISASLALSNAVERLLHFRSRAVRIVALLALALNPLIPVLSNQIGCEALFTVLELIWFILLLWMIMRPSWWLLLLHVLNLCLLFIVKDSGWHLALLSIIAFLWMMKAGRNYKLAGIMLIICAIGTVYFQVRKQTREITGKAVYSGLYGWQMANNALYIYPHADIQKEAFKDAQLQVIDSLAKDYFASMTAAQQQHFKAEKVGADFLWDNNAPLKRYLFLYQDQSKLNYLKAWYGVSVIFEQYGGKIIRYHPAAYVRYFIMPNLKNFIYPNPESLAAYNAFHEKWPEETIWYFRMNDREINPVDHSGLQHILIIMYRLLHALAILLCFLPPVIYLLQKRPYFHKRLAIYWLVFVLVSSLYSIATSFVLLRNEGIWFVMALGLPLWFLSELLSNQGFHKDKSASK